MARKNSRAKPAGSIQPNTIGEAQLKNNAVSVDKIKAEAVTEDKIDETVASTGKAIAMAIVFG